MLSLERRKWLVVIDDTPECRLAARFAARRAARTGGSVTLLRVLQPVDFQHWAAVGDLMRDEARQEAEALLTEIGGQIQDLVGLMPEYVIREGDTKDEILKQIEEDPAVLTLVLGAAAGTEGPGPLVSSFTGQLVGSLHIPLAIVPGNLSPEQIDEVC